MGEAKRCREAAIDKLNGHRAGTNAENWVAITATIARAQRTNTDPRMLVAALR